MKKEYLGEKHEVANRFGLDMDVQEEFIGDGIRFGDKNMPPAKVPSPEAARLVLVTSLALLTGFLLARL